jgi:hypothetical protein
MDLRETLARMKPLMGPGALLVTGGVWLVVFQSGWQSGDWAGFWSSSSDVRGSTVDIKGKRVENALEREQRLGITGKHVNETLYKAKKKLLGERAATLGNDVSSQREVPDMYRASEREACMEMQLEFPERYKDIDCMSQDISDDPWLPGVEAPAPEEDAEHDKAKKAAPADDAWSPNLRKSPLGRPDPPPEPVDPLARPRDTIPRPGDD